MRVRFAAYVCIPLFTLSLVSLIPLSAVAADGWVRQSLGAAAVPSGVALYGVSFVDATHGWVMGAVDRIYATTDGGAT